MRSRLMMLYVACALVFAAYFTAGLAQGRSFENKDTAADRQDSVWGTRMQQGQSYFGTDENENSVWGYRPAAPDKETDWYDKVILTVDPNVDWGGDPADE